jgi:ATP-binding cassette, subfamily B, bacterial MsbA
VNFHSAISLIQKGIEFLGVQKKDFLMPGALGALSTASRIIALSLFLPLVHGLFSQEEAGMGRFQSLMPNGISEGFPIQTLLIGLILTAALVSAVCSYISQQIDTKLSSKGENHANEIIFRQFLSFGKAYYDTAHLSKCAVNLRKFPQRATRLITFLNKNIRFSIEFSFYLIGMVFLSWELAFVVLVALIIYFVGFGRISTRLEDINSDLENANDEASAETQDILMNVELVRHTSTNEEEVSRWKFFSDKRSKQMIKQQQVVGFLQPAIGFFSVSIMLAVVIFSSQLIGEIEPYDIILYILFFLFFRRAMSVFSKFLRIPGELKNIGRDLERCFNLLDPANKGIIIGGKKSLSKIHDDITVQKLNFRYRKKPLALKDLSLSIPKNRTSIIVGASGSGKSTFLKLLLREYEATSGSIKLNGINIQDYSTESILKNTAFLGRDPLLFNNTIAYNLTYGQEDVSQIEIDTALQQTRCDEFVNQLDLGLQTDTGDHGNIFSPGERQRIGLARLLLKKGSSLFLLDEATSAIDASTEKAIIETLSTRENSTLILATHRLSIIKRDMHVIVFKKGRVVEQGLCHTLLSKDGPFRKLWSTQNLSMPN